MTTQNIVEVLKNGAAQIKFEKSDGTIREMKATLSPQIVSQDESDSATQNFDQINVWDLEVGAWRSFCPSRLISFTPVSL